MFNEVEPNGTVKPPLALSMRIPLYFQVDFYKQKYIFKEVFV